MRKTPEKKIKLRKRPASLLKISLWDSFHSGTVIMSQND